MEYPTSLCSSGKPLLQGSCICTVSQWQGQGLQPPQGSDHEASLPPRASGRIAISLSAHGARGPAQAMSSSHQAAGYPVGPPSVPLRPPELCPKCQEGA